MALRKQRRLSYVLEVAGLTLRYYAGVRPPTTALTGVLTDLGSAANYTDVQAITGLTALTEELRPFEGFVRHDPITITLASNSPKPRSSNDPAVVFGRGRPEAATVSGNLTVTLGMTASVEPGSPQDVYVDTDLSGLSFPRVIHVGREAMIATSAGGSQPDPSVANPFYVRVEERGAYQNQLGGVLDTRQQAHTVVTGGIPPVVTTPEITVWQRRRAVLRAAEVSPNGTIVTPYTDLFVGFLTEEPDLSSLGSVQLKLSPLTALLDSDASLARTSTTLIDGVHEWQTVSLGGVGDPVPIADTFEHVQIALSGDLYSTTAQADGNVGLQRLTVIETGSHGDVFDPENLDDGHPRVGYISTLRGPVLRPTEIVDGNTFEVAENAIVVNNGDLMGNAPASETHTAAVDYDDATQIDYQWPLSLGDFCLSDWIYLSTQGAGGAWLSVAPFSEDGFAAQPSIDPAEWGSRTAQVLDIRPKTWGRFPTSQNAVVPREGVGEWTPEFGSNPGRTPASRRCWYPYVITGEGAVRDDVVGGNETYTRIPVGAAGVQVETQFADSWYQTGEPWALLGESIDLTYSSTVRVEFYEPVFTGGAWQITRREFDAEVSGISSVVLSSTGQTAYRLSWRDPDSVPCFGNWSSFDGARPCRISAIPDGLRGVHPRTLLRAYLVSPLGLGLGVGDVDLGSIDRIEVPPSLSSLTLPSRLGAQPKIKDLVSGIMVASLSALSMVRGRDGRLRLGVINLGREQLFDITGSIGQGDWSVGEPPLSDWDQNTANVLEWSTLADEQGKPDPAGTFAYQFSTLIDRYGVQRVQASIRDVASSGNGTGIVAGLAGDLGGASYEIATLYGRPRRIWTGGIGVHLGHEAYVGSTWLVTSDRLQGTGSGYGVLQLAGRVVRREIDYWQGTCSIEISHHGAGGSGWNWSMDIESKTSNTEFVVGLTTNSQLGDTDTRLFVAGQDVRIVPEYDEDAEVVREIVSVTDDEEAGTSTIVVNAAWAGTLPARIEPETYDDASALLFRPYAYVADAAETLGAGGVAGPEIG